MRKLRDEHPRNLATLLRRVSLALSLALPIASLSFPYALCVGTQRRVGHTYSLTVVPLAFLAVFAHTLVSSLLIYHRSHSYPLLFFSRTHR